VVTITTVKKITDLSTTYPFKKEYIVSGTMDDVPFTLGWDEFHTKWMRRYSFYGMRNIKRTMDDMEETFEHLARFSGYLHDRANDCEDEDDEFEGRLHDRTIINALFCLDTDLFD